MADQANETPQNDNDNDWDGEFDADRARNTITALRDEIKELKAARHAAEAERDNAVKTAAAKNSEMDELRATLQLATDEAEAARKDHAELATLRTKEQLLAARGLDTKYVGNITGDDEDAWTASADALAELRGSAEPQEPKRNPDPAQSSEPVSDSADDIAREFFGLN